MPHPKYFPRSQICGVWYWTCVYCGRINRNQLFPDSFKVECGNCGKKVVHGDVYHIPSPNAKSATDMILPRVDDEYVFDPIPEAIWSGQTIKHYGRTHLLVLHENIVTLPYSNEAKEPKK